MAPARATVLLQGESGTGKELFARALHDRSPRHDAPFITMNCAGDARRPGRERPFRPGEGGVHGSYGPHRGAFERSHTGTLLLDEISEMRLDLQAKLLPVIQEQEFERVWAPRPSRWTCASSPRPTATSRARWTSDGSGAICTIGSMLSRFEPRRCGSVRTTSRGWCSTSSIDWPTIWEPPCRRAGGYPLTRGGASPSL